MSSPKSSNSAKKITRNRPVTSCKECSRRKQKCNKSWPCNHCLNRKSPQLCRYGVEKPSTKHIVSQSNINNSEQNQFSVPAPELDDHLNIDSSSIILGVMLTEKSTTTDFPTPTFSHDPRRTRHEILKWFPKRHTVDLLIQHFLTKVNWLFEEVYAPSFLERYNNWWCQSQYQSDGDVQFGIIILRICINALQFLPHPDGPEQSEIGDGKAFDELECACNETASKFDSYRPRKPSLLRVQQLLLNIVILLNNGNAKESHQILGEAIKEARDIDLFLESKWTGFSEFEKEERRKAFWCLYVWDRFHCTFLGRWPLIPEHYHSVQFPRDTQFSISTVENAPTQFTDVILNYKLYHYMASFMSAPGKESERTDPSIIEAHAKGFESQFINILPPCFRLENPDTSWDILIPTLPMKRLSIYVVIHGIIEGMHKCFVGPLTPHSMTSYVAECEKDGDRARLIRQHRHTLANACINAVTATRDLHFLMGGSSHRYFVLSIATIEASAMLGMMIVSDLLITTSVPCFRDVPLLEQGLFQTCQKDFYDGFNLLQLLAQRSVVAQKGIRVLEGLNNRIQDLKNHQNPQSQVRKTSSCDNSHTGYNDSNEGDSNRDSTREIVAISSNVDVIEDNIGYAGIHIVGSEDALQPTVMALEWESICTGNDFSWFFEDWNGLENGHVYSGQFEGGFA